MFDTLEVRPILGRLPAPEDEDRVAVISHTLWLTWFGADPAVIGRTYQMSGQPRTVIGVMGLDFRFPDDGSLLWIPAVFARRTSFPAASAFPWWVGSSRVSLARRWSSSCEVLRGSFQSATAARPPTRA